MYILKAAHNVHHYISQPKDTESNEDSFVLITECICSQCQGNYCRCQWSEHKNDVLCMPVIPIRANMLRESVNCRIALQLHGMFNNQCQASRADHILYKI